MFRTLVVSAVAVSSTLSQPVFAQSSPANAAIDAEIKATEARLVSLRRLAALRAEEAQLQAQLATAASPASAPAQSAPVAAASSNSSDAPASIVAGAAANTTSNDSGSTGSAGGTGGGDGDLATTPGKQSFGGLEFGIGLAFTYDLGHRDRIKEAILDPNGLVRVTRSENLRARIILESHYLFTPRGKLLGLENTSSSDPTKDRKTWGFGPFVALQPGTDNVIEAVGAGLMLGLKRPSDDPKNADSFNIGVGVMYDLNTQILGDGIVENQALPTGETEIRYRAQSQSGLLIMTSYSF